MPLTMQISENEARAMKARRTLEFFNEQTGPDGTNAWEQYLSDFICNVTHMLGEDAVDVAIVAGRAHFLEETGDGEDAEPSAELDVTAEIKVGGTD